MALEAKAGYWACPLHTTAPKGWAKHPSHPSSPTPGHNLSLTPYKEQACPPSGRQRTSKAVCCLFSLPSAAAGVPVKPCLNFLSCCNQFLLIKEAKSPGPQQANPRDRKELGTFEEQEKGHSPVRAGPSEQDGGEAEKVNRILGQWDRHHYCCCNGREATPR